MKSERESRAESRLKARIASSSASVNNERATDRLLHDVPHSSRIRAGIAKPFVARRWDRVHQRSFWVMSDGADVRCLTVNGLSIEEMATVCDCVDIYMSRDGFDLSPQTLREIIESELDVIVDFVN